MRKGGRLISLLTGMMLLFQGACAEGSGFHRPAGDVKMGLAAQLTWAFMSVAASSAQDAYGLWVSGNLDVRITDASGEYLSSKPGERKSGCSFGYLSTLGDSLDQKLLLFVGGDKTICLQGTETGTASYELLRLQGLSSGDETVCARTFETSEFTFERITLTSGVPAVEQLQYNPLEIGSRSPFNGALSLGSERTAAGTVNKGAKILAAPDQSAYVLTTTKAKTAADVLAVAGDYAFVAWLDADLRMNRGWTQRKNVSCGQEIPELVLLSGTLQTRLEVEPRLAPDEHAAALSALSAGAQVELVYAERDAKNQEWALVQTETGKKKQTAWVYVPASVLEGWQEKTPSGFRIGCQMPVYQWAYALGKDGYTEFMCAQPDGENDGVALSGRTSSKKGDLPARNGNLDAMILRLSPEGSLIEGKTYGGSDVESFHWIVPSRDGYYAAGYTRSTDKDFKEIWDPASHLNTAKGKLKSSLALMAKVDANLNSEWAVSFGTGEASHSFGFDMIIPLADGNWAGTGWMYDSKNSGLRGHGKQDFYVVKMSPDGRVLNAVSLGDAAQNVPDSAVPTPDGGLIMVGCTRPSGIADGLIMIIDSDLNVTNTITYGGSGEDIFDNIRALPDGTYLVTGFTNSVSGDGVGASHGGYDFWIMNVDAQDAAISFSRTLFALSPESRIGVVAYDDSAWQVAGLSGAEARQTLYSKIRAMRWGGMTNTGGGFAEADSLLASEGIAGRGQLALMLTDGLANEGSGDPIQYAIDCGTRLAERSLVYTVGMLGEQAQTYLNEVRRTLNAGYETRYFEVTFRDMEE